MPIKNQTTSQVIEMLDIGDPNYVEVTIREDARVLWVNVDGMCRLRISRIKKLVIEDERGKIYS